MDKIEVIKLSRRLFEIRVSAAREGPAEDDGVHVKKVESIPFFTDETMEKWYKEAIKTAEIIVSLEEQYLSSK